MHSSFAIKARHILPTFFTISIGVISFIGIFRWLNMHYHFLHFKLEVWETGIPVFLSIIVIAIWLRPRLKILTFDSEPEKQSVIFYAAAFCAIIAPSIIFQKYFSAIDGKLENIDKVSDIKNYPDAHYYVINNFTVVTTLYGRNMIVSESSGRSYNERLSTVTITNYFVFPIIGKADFNSLSDYKYWYGIKFSKQINGNLSDAAQQFRIREFDTECLNRLRSYDFRNAKYFVNLPNSDDLDNYQEAVRDATRLIGTDLIILEASHEPFENRAGNNLEWAFISYFLASSVFVLLLFWPGYNTIVLEKFIRKSKS